MEKITRTLTLYTVTSAYFENGEIVLNDNEIIASSENEAIRKAKKLYCSKTVNIKGVENIKYEMDLSDFIKYAKKVD